MKLKILQHSGFEKFFVPLKGYSHVRTVLNNDEWMQEWWLFPFNYVVQFWYWIKSLRHRI